MLDAMIASTKERELIAFRIGEQEFCVDIMAVREIRGWAPVTKLPHSPMFLRGVLNLRGGGPAHRRSRGPARLAGVGPDRPPRDHRGAGERPGHRPVGGRRVRHPDHRR